MAGLPRRGTVPSNSPALSGLEDIVLSLLLVTSFCVKTNKVPEDFFLSRVFNIESTDMCMCSC